MKKFYVIFFLILLINISNVSAENNCEVKEWFELYECRVENVCKTYKTNKVVYNTESFKKAEKYNDDSSIIDDVLFVTKREELPLKKAVATYKENMNNIYRCAIINSQLNSMDLVKKKLQKYSWSDLIKSIEPKIENLSNKLDIVYKSSKCSNINKNEIYNKENILKQTTYETCSYNYYMEYLKDYYSNIDNVLWINTKENKIDEVYSSAEVAGYQASIIKWVNQEIEQAYKTWPLVFNAYSEFENNFPLHFMLEIIKEDFRLFRDKLYQTLSPINQVVYKISNAMWLWN